MIIIVDSNAIAYQSLYAQMGNLTHKNMSVSVIFGFLKTILSIFKKYGSNNLVFAWDSKKSNRKMVFEDYKKGRRKDLSKEEEEKLHEGFIQFAALRMVVLPSMGFVNNFRKVGYEGDDIIASVTHRTRETEVVVVSSDHDFYQLLGSGIVMYDPKKRKELDTAWFEERFAITPLQWAQVLSIAGCTSDNVPGVPGVGIKTAIKYLKGELKKDSKPYKNIKNHKEEIELYDSLVRLPLQGTGKFEIKENRLSEKSFWDNFSYYGFHSFMKDDMWSDWVDLIGDVPF